MARQILTTTHQDQFGAEPINVIEVQWVEDGNRVTYADRDIPSENVFGKIVLLDKLDFVIDVNEGSDSQEINIGLSDVDGDLKDIIDNHDIHKRDVWVYQWFDGDDFADKFLIFQGQINSPITWNERDRTLKFTVISRIEDAEVGFSIEEGIFLNPEEDLIGKPWPLKFGTTINVPALGLSSAIEGTLSGGVGIRDFNLDLKLSTARSLVCPQVFRGFRAEYVGAAQLSLQITPVFTPDENCVLDKCRKIEELELKISEQGSFEFTLISIINGERFPQEQQITLNINGGQFTGQFLGTEANPSNEFEIISRQHPDFGTIPNTLQEVVDIFNAEIEVTKSNCIAELDEDELLSLGGGSFVGLDKDPSVLGAEISARSFALFNAIQCPGFFWADAGSKVTLGAGEEVIYISNIISETVLNVAAFRNLPSGQRILLTVPPSFYSTRSTDYNQYQVSEIVFPIPLSSRNEEWENDIFVISESSVGPNTVNILEFLIQKYTKLSIDSTSFDLVRASVEPYPSDFPVLDRPNVLDLLRDIAFQARCAIFVRDKTFFLKYLPTLATFDDTITESDIDENTLELFHTNTEDLVTKLIADWKRDYSKEDGNKIILRHNIIKYGTHEETFNFFIYNELDYVHKSATFWLIRKSNTWRHLRFKTPLQKLKLETFDSVGITLPDLADGEVCGVVTKSDYDSDRQTVEFEIWTSIRSGTREKYNFAFPADIDEFLIWPTEEDRDKLFAGSGDAPGFSIFAPAGHALSIDLGLTQGFSFGPCASQGGTERFETDAERAQRFNESDNPFGESFLKQVCGGGDGDSRASDKGDTKKPKQTEADIPAAAGQVDIGEINVGDRSLAPDANASILARIGALEECCVTNRQLAANALEASGGTGGSGGGSANPLEDLPSADDLPEGTCKQQVEVDLHIGDTLFSTGVVGSTDPGYPGIAPFVRRDIHTFNSIAAMNTFALAIQAEIQSRRDAEDVSVGETFPFNFRRIQDFSLACASEPDDPGLIAFDQQNPDGSKVDDFVSPEYLD